MSKIEACKSITQGIKFGTQTDTKKYNCEWQLKILTLLNTWVKYGVYNSTPNWTIYTTGPDNDYGLLLQTNCKGLLPLDIPKCTVLTPRTAIKEISKILLAYNHYRSLNT